VIAFQHTLNIVRDHRIRHGRTYQRVHADRPFYTVNFINLIEHFLFLHTIHIFIHEDHMHVSHFKILFQFFIRHITVKRSRKRLSDIIIDLRMVVSVNCREQKDKEQNDPDSIMFRNKL